MSKNLSYKYLIWGTGNAAKKSLDIFHKINIDNAACIVAFIDNDINKAGKTFGGYPIISPEQIQYMEYDYISIWSTFHDEIILQLKNELKIPRQKLKNIYSYYLDKCRFTQPENKLPLDEIKSQKKFINNMKQKNMLDVYAFQPQRKSHLYKAYYDKSVDLYYILFESKRMYINRHYNFILQNNEKYVHDIWYEQDINSPHRYEYDRVYVKEGDVIVDAGACEGNFTLHNIDKISKAYIIECNPNWVEALKCTFAPYHDKVVICQKYLSKDDSETTIKLDTLAQETINFLKMDIEGEEINALNGAINLINTSNDFRCAICSYHRHGDEEKIKKLLADYNMIVSTSNGYMLFLYDSDIYKNPELRKGIVRGVRMKNTLPK